MPLTDLEIGQEVEIVRVDRPETTLCRYLEERGILPGVTVELVDEAPYNGPLAVCLDGKEIALGREISGRVFARPKAAG